MHLNIKLLSPHAQLPSYAHLTDAAMDLYSAEEHIIPPRSRTLISTGIALQWYGEDPSNYYLRIAPRSGLSVKGIDVGAGVIDFSYTGIIKVLLINNTDQDYQVHIGDRIAQGILTQINRFITMTIVDDLEETDRDQNGFGSSGI